jgi:hypothetical protein
MAENLGFAKRVEKYRASKTVVFWSCAACTVATIVVGFAWGGWVTGGTAREMATKAATSARSELAAAFCVHQFVNAPDATTKLASLKAADSWKRDTFISDGGWTKLPGTDEAVAGAASLCATQLIEAKATPVKAAGAAQ